MALSLYRKRCFVNSSSDNNHAPLDSLLLQEDFREFNEVFGVTVIFDKLSQAIKDSPEPPEESINMATLVVTVLTPYELDVLDVMEVALGDRLVGHLLAKAMKDSGKYGEKQLDKIINGRFQAR